MEPLTKEQRMQRVLGSQGFPMGRTFPPATTDALSALCGEDGVIVEGVREKFQQVIGEYHDAMKAVVDYPTVEVRATNIERTTTVSTEDGTLVPDWEK